MYKIALKKAEMIYFQNVENMNFMINNFIVGKSYKLIPGSGVNLNEFNFFDYPKQDSIIFLFIGRVMKEKGIDYFLEMSKFIKDKFPFSEFYVLGFCEEDYLDLLEKEYKKKPDDMRSIHLLGREYFIYEQYEDCINVLSNMSQFESTYTNEVADAYMYIGKSHHMLNDLDQAAAAFKRGTKVAPYLRVKIQGAGTQTSSWRAFFMFLQD
jgi:glycosyltransferase involved in cell wall biosynthesis